MSVAGSEADADNREIAEPWSSRRGIKVRARGLDGSPRNVMMSRTGVREGLKWKCFWHEGVCDTPVHVVFVGAYAIRPYGDGCQKHWSGKPDGAAGGGNVSRRWSVNVCLRRLEASPPKPRRLAQK